MKLIFFLFNILMEETKIKLKKSNKNGEFVKYLKELNTTKDNIFIKNQKLKEYFDFDDNNSEIKVSISKIGNIAYRFKIFGKLFYFFSNIKTIEEFNDPDIPDKSNIIKFETFDEEDVYLTEIKNNNSNFSFELNLNGNWIKEDLNILSPKIYRPKIYRIRNTVDFDDTNKMLDSNYKFYIPIDDINIYKDFNYIQSDLRDLFFHNLELYIISSLNCNYFP